MPVVRTVVSSMQASKEVGLAKQLVAPVRDAKAKPAASSALAVTGGAGGGSKEAAAAAAKAVDTAGRKWFDLPATQITDDVKRELRLLRLRGALDAQRFYKSAGGTKFPKYFHMGTVIDGPEDYYSGRLTNRCALRGCW